MSVPLWVWAAGGLVLLIAAVLLLRGRGKKGPAMEWVMPDAASSPSASPSASILDAPREATVDHATASLDMTFDDLPLVPVAEPAPAPVPAPAPSTQATSVMASPVHPPRAPAAPAPAAKSAPAVPVGRSPSPLSLEQEVASAQARMPAASSRPSVEIKPLDADLASLAEALQEFEPHAPSARAPTVPAPAPAPPPPSKSNPFLRESSGLSLEEQPEAHLVPMPGAFEHELHEAFPEPPIAKERHVVDFGDPFKKAPAEPAPVVETPSAALTRALGEAVPERATTPQATLESELQAAAEAVLGDDDELRAASGGDAIATKLELARAYLDMDDDESAVHILEEVLHEGDAEQKQTATAMLAEARKR
jgi:FimV-like protein